MSGYKFSYGLVCFNVINVIISIYFKVSYALLLSEYEFVLFMHNFTFVWNLSCAEYCFDVELFYYVNWGSAHKNQQSSLLHYLLCLVYLALYLAVFCNDCLQSTTISEPSLLTRNKPCWPFHRLQVWIFASLKYIPFDLRHVLLISIVATVTPRWFTFMEQPS